MRTTVVIPLPPADEVQKVTGGILWDLFGNRFGGSLAYAALAVLLAEMGRGAALTDWGILRYFIPVVLALLSGASAMAAFLGLLMFRSPAIVLLWSCVAASMLFRPLLSLDFLGHSTASSISAWLMIWVVVTGFLAALADAKEVRRIFQALLGLALLPGLLTFAVWASKLMFFPLGWTTPMTTVCADRPVVLCYGVSRQQFPDWFAYRLKKLE